MKLTTSELVYINEAAKALKQKNFILIDNIMIGIDNIQSIVTYVLLDTNFMINYNNGIIINQRQLSAFVKALSIESDFEFNIVNGSDIIRTISGIELQINYNQMIAEMACDKFKYAVSLESNIPTIIDETEIPDVLTKVQSMKSGDGAIGINYNGYYIILFPALLPTVKSDKLYIKILQPPLFHTFISKFHIKKKKFDIITYVNYLKV